MTDNFGNNTESLTGSSGGDSNPNHNMGGGPSNTDLPLKNDDDEKLKRWMADRLTRYRVSQAGAENGVYLGENFTPAEHEYISEKVLQYNKDLAIFPKSRVAGTYPDRRYTGKITLYFIKRFFID